MRIKISALTDAGKERDNNEDSLLFCPDLGQQQWQTQHTDDYAPLSPLGALLIVADGMGGANAGEVASSLAVEAVKDYFQPSRIQAAISQDLVPELLQRVVVTADDAVNQRISRDPSTEGMGTTIVLCWMHGDSAHLAWCGDSRGYAYNPVTGLRRLTTDHSYVQELIQSGELTEEEAFKHPENNIITRGLGDFQATPAADIVEHQLQPNDILMLCSDGLCGYCSDHDIEQVIHDTYTDADLCAQQLMQLALDAGGCDNIAITVASLIGDDDEAPSQPMFAPLKRFFNRLMK